MQISLDGAIEMYRGGFIYVITGSMFAGKTGKLIRNLRRIEIRNEFSEDKKKIVLFKPQKDDRHKTSEVISHNDYKFEAEVVPDVETIAAWVSKNKPDIVAIDEAQFFKVPKLLTLLIELANQGKVIILTVLDQDFACRPFEGVPELLAEAEIVEKLHPICVGCGKRASRTFRLSDSKELIQVGGKEDYTALCRACRNDRS
jgi:thymidine kinase